MNISDLTEQDLLNYYVEEKLSLRAIAKIYNSTYYIIKTKLLKLNIKIRKCTDSHYYKSREGHRKSTKPILDSAGYIRIGDKRQHKLVFENKINRKLKASERIHHIDFNKTNNIINNLFLFKGNTEHMLYHSFIIKNPYIRPNTFVKYVLRKYKKTIFNKDWLYQEYILKNKSLQKIAIETNTSKAIIKNKLQRFNILNLKPKKVNKFL